MEHKDVFQIKDPALRQRAELELGETDDIRKESLAQLKTLIRDDQRICGEVKDELLIAYLRTTKFDTKAAYGRVKKLAQILTNNPLLSKWMSEYSGKETMLQSMNQSWLVYPEGHDLETRKVLTILAGSGWDPDEVSMGEIFTAYLLTLFAEALDERSQVGGFVILCDYKGIGVKLLRQLTPSLMYLCGCLLKDCLPIRIKQLHMSNLPILARGIVQILSSFVGEKIRSRFHVYGRDFSAEASGISEDLLPVDFGGKCPNVTQTSHVANIIERAEEIGLYQSLRDLKYS